MARYAQTVTGTVDEAKLGMTLLHEHILCDLRPEWAKSIEWPPITIKNRFEVHYFQNRNQANMILDEDDVALAELHAYRAVGGNTIVDLTTGGLSPQPSRLRALSILSGVNIVVGAGFYVDAYLSPDIRSAPIDLLTEILVGQLRDGAWGTEVRAGLIGEIGCSWPLADSERRMLQAAAIAQRITGATITLHPGRHPDAPAQIADILRDAGADPALTIMGHIDRTVFDRPRLMNLLNRGLVLEWDFFGIETSQYWMAGVDLDLPTDYMRLDRIRDLIQAGHRNQIAVSQDICIRTRLNAYGGHGYGHLPGHVVPLMRRRGFAEDDIETLLIRTPARLLAYRSESHP